MRPQESLQLEEASDPRLTSFRSFRTRKAGWSVAANYFARSVAVAIYFVSVPLTLNYLDKERYGLWLTISSIISYLNLTDLGLGLGLQNRIAEARGRGKEAETGELLSTAFLAMLAVGGLVAIIGITIIRMAPLGGWFHVSSPPIEAELRNALIVIVLTFAYLLPARMINSAQNGFQESYFGDLWSIGSSVMSLAALIIVIVSKGDMMLLALVSFALAQLLNIANIGHFFHRHPYARLSWRKVRLQRLPYLFSIGWQFFLIQICTLIIWQTDNLVIATQRGADQVVPYAVAFRLIWLPLSLLSSVPGTLWPAYTEAKARGDWHWIRVAYRRTTAITVFLAVMAAIIIVIWGQEFIRLWAGSKAKGDMWLMTALCAYLILGHWTNCNAIMVNAIGRQVEQVFSGLLDASLNLGLSLYLIRIWGLAGVGWGTTLACLLVSSWFLPWSVWRATDKRVAPPWREALSLTLIPATISFSIGVALAQILPLEWSGYLRVCLGVFVMGTCGITSAYLFLPKEWRLAIPFIKSYPGRES